MNLLPRYLALRFIGTFFYVTGALVALPWTIGAVFAYEFMLKPPLLWGGVVSWPVTLFGIFLMRRAEAFRRERAPHIDPMHPFRAAPDEA
jgi:hypothetical protein